MDESRKQFEEYWDNETGSRDGRCKSLRSGLGYRNDSANECWVFWQAGRKELQSQQLATSEKVRQQLWQSKFGKE